MLLLLQRKIQSPAVSGCPAGTKERSHATGDRSQVTMYNVQGLGTSLWGRTWTRISSCVGNGWWLRYHVWGKKTALAVAVIVLQGYW